jgi:transglutaminase superfamily protein
VQSYFLAPHVYPCVTDDHVVLLDLQRDKYVGVAREQMASLAERVKGWPLGRAPESAAPAGEIRTPNARADNVVGKMLAAGMLTTDPAVGKEATPVEMPRAEIALIEEDLETRPAVRSTHVTRFLRACALTSLSMKLRSMEAVIASVERRRAAGRAACDLDVARPAVAAFIRLRPLLFRAQDACLFDSLALMRYLSYYGVFPTCVLGVQTGPFAAHCWVQHQGIVFNDAPEYVRRFTPILAV